jgi:hypothetical protein
MDVSELRKRILRALDDARKDAADRRASMDQASQEYRTFLDTVATPLMRQAVDVLRGEKQPFSLQTPAESVRIVSDASSQTFLEFELDRAGRHPQVVGRISLVRGRQGQVIDERAVGGGKPVAALTEDDVTTYLVDAIPKLVLRP